MGQPQGHGAVAVKVLQLPGQVRYPFLSQVKHKHWFLTYIPLLWFCRYYIPRHSLHSLKDVGLLRFRGTWYLAVGQSLFLKRCCCTVCLDILTYVCR